MCHLLPQYVKMIGQNEENVWGKSCDEVDGKNAGKNLAVLPKLLYAGFIVIHSPRLKQWPSIYIAPCALPNSTMVMKFNVPHTYTGRKAHSHCNDNINFWTIFTFTNLFALTLLCTKSIFVLSLKFESPNKWHAHIHTYTLVRTHIAHVCLQHKNWNRLSQINKIRNVKLSSMLGKFCPKT